jgi:hypothetical protein
MELLLVIMGFTFSGVSAARGSTMEVRTNRESFEQVLKCIIAGSFWGDLKLFSPTKAAWTDITFSNRGILPTPRRSMGMTSDEAGKLYVFGGINNQGIESSRDQGFSDL